MSQGWLFVAAAYAVAIGGTLALALASLAAMRRAERRDASVRGARGAR